MTKQEYDTLLKICEEKWAIARVLKEFLSKAEIV